MAHEFKHKQYLMDSLGFFKSNLVPSAVAGVGMMIPVVGSCVMVNFMRAQKAAKSGGEPLSIGKLFSFENLVPNFIAQIIWTISYMCCMVPGIILFFTMPIMADRPGTEPLNAVKGALAFGKQNAVGLIILAVLCGVVSFVAFLPLIILNVVLTMVAGILGLLVLPLFLGMGAILTPIFVGTINNAYLDAQPSVLAAAAEAGVQLA
jgi:hypothetical protein